jgi:hypothetical protein
MSTRVGGIRVINKLPIFSVKAKMVLDDALAEASKDILIDSKNIAPFKKGGLRSDSLAKKMKVLHWRVSYNKEYARYQEYGGDGKRVIRKYTTPGTGKAYLKTAGDNKIQKMIPLFKKHGIRVRV